MHARHATVAFLLLAGAGIASAHGPTTCEAVPQAEWKPQMELQSKLKTEGWKVRQVKTHNNCYEVYGIDDKGERVEAFFHPKTFERVAEADSKPADK